MQSLARRLEKGGVLSCPRISHAAQPFFAALLQKIFLRRPVIVVTDGLKTQESFQQDLETWLALGRESRVESREQKSPDEARPRPSTLDPRPFFYSAWETLPHEGKLPHADTISERLQTLVALNHNFLEGGAPRRPNFQGLVELAPPKVLPVVTNVTALLQKTFPPGEIQKHTRRLERGEKIEPLDLIEWLEEQSYEPEAQVTQKGEIALRGGILDVWPLTSPWPARLEFFGDELESLRHFDPFTQISREEIPGITIPPGGELGILKKWQLKGDKWHEAGAATDEQNPVTCHPPLATLLDYLPRETIFLLCEPEQLALRADEYARQIPKGDPFFIAWENFLAELERRGMTRLDLSEADTVKGAPVSDPAQTPATNDQYAESEFSAPIFSPLDAYRPLAERAPELQIAEAQRREFFNQVHRWLRQGYAVHVFCNNDGERQRFDEIWAEQGFGAGQASRLSPSENKSKPENGDRQDACPTLHLGTLARGFLCDEARLVVVTDAEIFGRYKIQRPRRLKSPHALATRSALDIDFTELEEGDLVVHLQYGIGRFLGLKNLPAGSSRHPSTLNSQLSTGTECLVIEYAPRHPGDEPPKLYVPVTEAHLVSKYVGVGKVRPPLNTLGGTRWNRAKEQAGRAVRDVAAELLQIQAVRESQAGHSFPPDAPWQREFEGAFIFEETSDQLQAIGETKSDMERPKPMDRLICGDVGFGKTEVAIRAAFKAVMGGKQVA
ncbi:MAG: CarD family transcriptional regulator, partial [Verrucomicrobiota bacterium]